MPPRITVELLHDPALSQKVKELQAIVSRRYLPKLGQEKLVDAEYNKPNPVALLQLMPNTQKTI